MNINRLFELAGLPNNDILLEAAYDNMVTAIKQKFPEQSAMIDENIKKAKKILTAPDKKAPTSDKMIWYIKVLRAYLLNDMQSTKGTYNFKDMEQFNNDFFHYYGLNLPQIFNIELANQNISELFQKFDIINQQYQKSDKPPVPVKKGDYELIHFPDGSGWWFIDRAYCKEEGRSGKHCGNVVGQDDESQRILSLRTPNHNVILTFILLENGYLGEMKAKANQKPSAKYHPHIMQLLLNPMVKGIKGSGYASYMNFSIFDLSEHNIEVLINHGKKSFIANQIKAEPIEFLNAPTYIKNNKEYQQVAINAMPALGELIGKETDLDAWKKAIRWENSLILYAPESYPDFKNLVITHILYNADDLVQAPKSVSHNFDILKPILERKPEVLQYVVPNTPRYTELCKIAVSKNGNAIKYVPEELRTIDMWKLALSDKRNEFILRDLLPPELNTFDMLKIALSSNGGALRYAKLEDFTDAEKLELYKIAATQTVNALRFIPEESWNFDVLKAAVSSDARAVQYVAAVNINLTDAERFELYKIAVTKDIRALQYIFPRHIKDKIKQELNIQESLDFKYFQNL
jgi:hypothetical protein